MPPVGAAIAGALAATGASVATALGAPLAGTWLLAGTSSFAMRAFAQIAVGVALSAISRMLMPRPRGASVGGVRAQVQFGEDKPATAILGRFATAGDLVYAGSYAEAASDTPNEFYVMVVELADFPCRLRRVLVNGEYVTLAATGDAGPYKRGRAASQYRHKGNDHLWIRFCDGTQTAADAGLLSAFGDADDRPWQADMIGRGIPYAIITARFNPKVHRGVPEVLFELDGMRLYDPRRDTSVGGSGAQRWADASSWTPLGGAANDNPVVQIYNLMLGLRDPVTGELLWGGQEITQGDLPLDSWFAAMNACDANAVGHQGVERAYRAGIEISFTEDAEAADAIEELLKACQGQIAQAAGKWTINAGPPGSAVYAFTDDDVIVTAPDEFDPFPGLDQTFNGVDAVYPEPEDAWQPKDAAPRRSAAWLAEDRGRLQVAALQFPCVPYRSQVQRLMKSALQDQRRFRRHTLVLPPEARALAPLDVVAWTSARNGYEDKLLSIDVCEDLPNGCVAVALREVDPNDYDFDESDLSPSEDGFLGRPPVVAMPFVFSVEAATIRDGAGTGRRPAIRLSWNPGIRGMLGVRYRIRVADQPGHLPRVGGFEQSDDDLVAAAIEVFAGEPLEVFAGEPLELGYFSEVERGTALISEGLLPATAYEVAARYDRPGRDGPWSGWMAVTTPDTRLSSADLDGLLNDRIDQALDAAEAAAADAATALSAAADALDRVETLAGDTVEELEDLLAEIAAFDAGELIAANLLSLRALQTGWNNDPTFQKWTSGPDYWTLSGLSSYATQFTGFYGSGIELDIPSGAIGGTVRASSETAGEMDAGDPTASWVVMFALVTFPTGSTSAFRIRPEWKISGTWTRGDMKGLTAPAGSFAELGITATAGLQQGIEVLVQKPAGSASAVSILFEKDAGVTGAAHVQLHLLGMRRASDAEIEAGQAAANLSAAVSTLNTSITGVSSALAAAETSLTASIDAVSANLTTNYMTSASVTAAVAAAQSSLGASIAGVSANLATNYYTSAETDDAIGAAVLTLSTGTVGGLSAALSDEMATRVTADAALSGRITSLEARREPTSVVSNGAFATGVPTSGAPTGWASWPAAFSVVARGGDAPQASAPTAFMLRIAPSGSNQSAWSERYEAKEGDRISTVAFLYAAGGTTRNVSLRVRIHWQSVTFSDLGTVETTGPDNYTSTAWARWEAPVPPAVFAAAPAGTAYVQIEVQRLTASSAGDAYLTQIEARKGDPAATARIVSAEAAAVTATASVASLTSTIGASFGSTAAFLSQMSAVSAKVDLLASTYVLRQRAGAATGSLEAVAFATPDGTALSTFKLDYDYINLEGRVLARDLVIADSTNMVPDDQLQDAAGWGITAATTEWALLPDGGMAGSVGEVRWTNLTTPLLGVNSAVLAGQLFPVTVGDKLSVSYKVRAANAHLAWAQLEWLDEARVRLSLQNIDKGSTVTGSLASRTHSEVVVVPTDAAYARWRWAVDREETSYTLVRFAAPLIRRQSPAIEIADGAITAPKINVSDLGAVVATLGTCTITSALNFAPGVVITGALGLNAVSDIGLAERTSLLTLSVDDVWTDLCTFAVEVISGSVVILDRALDLDRPAMWGTTLGTPVVGTTETRLLRGSTVLASGNSFANYVDSSPGTGIKTYKYQIRSVEPPPSQTTIYDSSGNELSYSVTTRTRSARVEWARLLVQCFKR